MERKKNIIFFIYRDILSCSFQSNQPHAIIKAIEKTKEIMQSIWKQPRKQILSIQQRDIMRIIADPQTS